MAPTELSLIRDTLDVVKDQLAAQRESDVDTQQLIKAQTTALKEVEGKLPSFIERRQFWPTIGAVILIILIAVGGGVLVVRAIAGARDDAIRKNSCALRGVLAQAQSSGTRNPIPPGLDDAARAFVEESRKRGAEFYASTLADLDATLRELGGPPCAAPPTPGAAT